MERLRNAEMMLKSGRVFDVDAGEDFRFPVNGSVAMLTVLCEAGVGPFTSFSSALVLLCTGVYATACLTNIDGFRFALAAESVNAFAFAGRGLSFVAGAEYILKRFSTLMEEIASGLGEGALKLL